MRTSRREIMHLQMIEFSELRVTLGLAAAFCVLFGTSGCGGRSVSVVGTRTKGGLASSAWPKFRGNAMNTGLGTGTGADGTVKWSVPTSNNLTWSSPAIGTYGTIYIGSGDGGIYAVSSDGIPKWTYRTGASIQASPAIGADGTVYVGSLDNKVHAVNPNGSLYAIGRSSGTDVQIGQSSKGSTVRHNKPRDF